MSSTLIVLLVLAVGIFAAVLSHVMTRLKLEKKSTALEERVRSIEQERRGDPIMTQSGQERLRSPAAMRYLVLEPRPTQAPSPQRCHVCLGPGLIDEHKPSGIDACLALTPLTSPARYVGAVLLRSNQGLFLWL